MVRAGLARGWFLFLTIVGLTLAVTALPAQPARDAFTPAKLTGNSPRAATRLASARALVTQKKWAEAIAEYQSILDEHGDELVPASPQRPNQYVAVRRMCQHHLAALPAPALRLYRARVDESAGKRLAPAATIRDTAGLQRIVDETFCSRPAERAIDLLGDLAFERGDFLDAERWWRLLALPCSEAARPRDPALDANTPLLYPDPQINPALVRTKQMLAQLFRGDRAAVRAELGVFKITHPRAEGLLAGRKGAFADILQGFADRKDLGGPVAENVAWPTFAGAATRTPPALPLPRCRWLEEPWRVRLDGKAIDGRPDKLPLKVADVAETARRLAFCPIIVGDSVIVADARTVSVHDLVTGRLRAHFNLLTELKAAGVGMLDETLPVKYDERFTLTVADGRLYARLGATARRAPGDAKDGDADSYLVCLDLPPVNGKLALRWHVASRSRDKEPMLFEGAPLVHAGRAYAAQSRFTRTWAVTEIDCYNAETGGRRWRQEVCEGSERAGTDEPRHRQHLLTAAGPNIVYCSHSGAIVALDALTGKRAWAVRYPRRGYQQANGVQTPRDLCPCVAALGRIYAAPADCDRILCLDGMTGRLLWESKPLEVVQLLGVAQHHLVFTTGNYPAGIRALNATTGADLRSWLLPEDGSPLPSMGRGLFAGHSVLWPTVDGLRILDLETGRSNDLDRVALAHVPPGNLAAGNGCLVVATGRELLGYVSPRRLLEQRRSDAAAHPNAAAALHRLALAQADAGLPDAGGRYLKHLQRLACAEDIWAGVADGAGLPGQRYEVLLTFARQAAQAQDWDTAAGYLNCIADADSAAKHAPWQTAALMEQAELWQRAGRPEKAVAIWHLLESDSALRWTMLLALDGTPQVAGLYAARQIGELIRQHGPAVYAAYERQAAELLAKGVRDVADRFPSAGAVRQAQDRRAKECVEQQQWTAAADVYRWQLLYRGGESATHARNLVELARCNEQQGDWDAARGAWQRLVGEHGDMVLGQLDAGQPARAFVARHLQRAEFQNPAIPDPPDVALPLTRSWHLPFSEPTGERLLVPEPAAGAPDDRLLFVRADNTLCCRDASSGTLCWVQRFDAPITWAAHHADLLLVAGSRGVFGLRLRDGSIFWSFLALAWPFAAPEGGLSGFRLATARLFFFQDQRRLFVLDADTGEVAWHRDAPGADVRPLSPGGRFQPMYHAGRDDVLLQTSMGHVWLLDSQTGQPRTVTPTKQGAWLQPPLPLGDRHVCLVPDVRHVVLLDRTTGREVWTHAIERSVSLTGEVPQLVGAGNTLLLCVARNYGYELQRLDVATGARRWAKPVFYHRQRPDLGHAALDATSVYLAVGDLLHGLALEDGKRRWELPLSSSADGWRVIATRRWLLAHPVNAQLDRDAGLLLRRYLLLDGTAAYPTVAPLPIGTALTAAAVAARLARSPSRFPVLLCDPKDGQVVQRLNFVSHGRGAVLAIIGRRMAVGLADAAWGLQ